MPTVDSQVAAWLKAAGLYAVSVPSGGVSWPVDQTIDATFMSPIDGHADALTEGARTAAFLAGPNAKERITVAGRRRDLLFKCITAKNPKLGYSGAGKNVFVIGVSENENNTTALTVIRKL